MNQHKTNVEDIYYLENVTHYLRRILNDAEVKRITLVSLTFILSLLLMLFIFLMIVFWIGIMDDQIVDHQSGQFTRQVTVSKTIPQKYRGTHTYAKISHSSGMYFGPQVTAERYLDALEEDEEDDSSISSCSSVKKAPSNIQNIYNLEIGVGKRNPNRKTENIAKTVNNDDGPQKDEGPCDPTDDIEQQMIEQQQIEMQMEEDEFLKEYQRNQRFSATNSVQSKSDRCSFFSSHDGFVYGRYSFGIYERTDARYSEFSEITDVDMSMFSRGNHSFTESCV